VYCMILLLTGLSVNILGPVGPALMHQLSSSTASVGAIFSAEGLGNFIGSALAGWVLHRYSAHRVITWACGVIFVGVGAVPSCSALSQVMLLYLLVGAAAGVANASANTMVTWVWRGSSGRLGAVLNLVNACFPLGGSAAPLLVLLSERRLGNPLVAFLGIAVFAALPCIGGAVLQTPSAPPAPPAELPSPPACGNSFSSAALGGSTVCGIDLGSRQRYIHVTVLAPLLITIWLCIGAEIAYSAWVFSFATHRAGMRSDEAALLTSLYWSTFTVGRVGATPLAAFISPGAILLPALCLEVVSLVALAVLNPSQAVLWVGTIGAGLGISALFSNVLSLLACYSLLTTRVTGAMGAAAAIGHMTIPTLAGLCLDRIGYDSLMPLLCAINAIGFGLTTAVVVHLRRNFQPRDREPDGAANFAAKQSLVAPLHMGVGKRWEDQGGGAREGERTNGKHRWHDGDRVGVVAL
jgi:fucose permease